MEDLVLTEPDDGEDLIVRLEGSGSNLSLRGHRGGDDLAEFVLGQVLVERVKIELNILGRLAQAKRIKAIVTDQRTIKVIRGGDARVPQRPVTSSLLLDCGLLRGANDTRAIAHAEGDLGEGAQGRGSSNGSGHG